jgi:hypothetical protein
MWWLLSGVLRILMLLQQVGMNFCCVDTFLSDYVGALLDEFW